MSDRIKLMLVWPTAGFFVVIAFGVGVIATAAFDSNEDGTPLAVSARTQVLDVELGELYVKPAVLEAAPGDVTIRVHNAGKIEHNFSIGSLGATELIAPGDTATLSLAALPPGTYAFQCDVPGHAQGGMMGSLEVGGKGGDAGGGTADMSMSARSMMDHDAAVTAQFPAATEGQGAVPLEPEIAADGTKIFRVVARQVAWEVEPGRVVEAWGYNGTIPGPTIQAELGDRVRIVLTNALPEPTTIHFHGMTVPADMDGVPVISQEAVMPGEKFVYEFVIRNTGSHMYHSHFDAAKQVPMGLLGAFIVPDRDDPRVDIDQVLVLNDGPLGYTLNGKGFPATQPIVAEPGQTVRIRYMNEGLQIHPMHLHGMPQRVIAKDGHLLKHPYWADTVLVGPGERYDVVVKANRLGAWAFHCHILNHVEGPTGMFGMVTALVVARSN